MESLTREICQNSLDASNGKKPVKLEFKQSIISKLLRIFPEVSVYKEAKTSLSYPHFFIYQISLSDEQERKNYHIFDKKIIYIILIYY